MSDTKRVEELIQRSKNRKRNINLEKKAEDEVTYKLENEKILKYSDLTNEDITVINIKEDLKEFDYLNFDVTTELIKPNDEIEEELEKIQLEDAIENIERNKEIKEKVKKKKHMPNIVDTSSAPLIVFDDVHLKYGKEEVLANINLQIRKGEFVYFVGKSGAGKSSLIKMIYRDVKNTKGKLHVDGENVTRCKVSKLPKLRRKIGVIFQDYKLLENKTVYENVLYSLEVTRYKRSKRKKKVLETLKKVGIIEKKDSFPNELSGGQQQRVAIARAIVDDPLILVADEPTGNLDPENAIAIMEILRRINEQGTTVVMATHDVGIVNKYVSRVILFKDGKIENESTGGYIYE